MQLLWHVPQYSPIGCGMSARVRGLVAGLTARGHALRLIAPADGVAEPRGAVSGAVLERFDVAARPVVHWSMQALRRRWRATDLARTALAPCDAVLTCQPEFAAAARERLSCPVVVVSCCCQLLYRAAHRASRARHGWRTRMALRLNEHLLERGERVGLRAAAAVAFDSAATLGTALRGYGLAAERCHVVSPTVDVARFRPARPHERDAMRAALELPADAFVVAWAGRMDDEKNVSLLIDALALAGDALPAMRLLLIGDGPQRDGLARRAEYLGVTGQVRFAGRRADVERCLHAADAFALPSRVESFGIAVLEAMACGLPCVVLGEIPGVVASGAGESVSHEQTGLVLSDAGPRSMAEAWLRLAGDAPQAAEWGRAGRARAEARHAPGRDAAELEQILERVAHRN
ncbi:MAG: glycosyltransferase family 4 protein [Phycisphaerae bacterium]